MQLYLGADYGGKIAKLIRIFADYSTRSIMTLAISILLFCVFLSINFRGNRMFFHISKATFGVYLIHPLFIDVLDRFLGITIQSFHQILSVPALSAVVFLASLGASILINKIPLINKWIV